MRGRVQELALRVKYGCPSSLVLELLWSLYSLTCDCCCCCCCCSPLGPVVTMLAIFFGAVMARAVQAQSFGNEINTYGTVAFVRSGESTPWVRSGTQLLTALGAQQMHELGSNFRGRYIDETSGSTRLGSRPIAGMSQAQLDPDQLLIQTLNRPHLIASAQAFMQGLYPPSSLNDTRNGPWPDATGLLGNRSEGSVDYPLGGYQYANIQALSDADYQTVYINGHDACPAARLESASYEITEQYLNTQAAERDFYQSLSLDWFGGDIPDIAMLDYSNAFSIYDALTYHYTHDKSTFDALTSEENAGVLDKVRYLANQDAWYRYGNVSADDDYVSTYRAMSGKTLAALVLGRFQEVIKNGGNATNGLMNGNSQPLTLFFGDFDPILSFLSIAEVDYQQHTERWHAIPDFASALVFELFTRGEAKADSEDNMWVRFSYHNGTDDYEGTAPQAYSMFRNGPSRTDMTWRDFSSNMQRVMMNQLSDWCDACSSPAFYCYAVDDPTVNVSLVGPAHAKQKISPTVAGVIGAVVTLAVAGLLFAGAMLLGGIRFHRVDRGRKSSLGGFKGSAKLASDADLNLPKNGVAPAGVATVVGGAAAAAAPRRVPHERVGSWELRQKEGGASERGSFEAIEAAMGRPVEPVERV